MFDDITFDKNKVEKEEYESCIDLANCTDSADVNYALETASNL